MTSVTLFPAFVLEKLSEHNFAGALEATLGGKHPYRQHGNGINWISGLFPHWSENCTME